MLGFLNLLRHRHIHDLHNEIRKKIQVSNSQYKIHANTHRRHAKFQVGDYVMIQILIAHGLLEMSYSDWILTC